MWLAGDRSLGERCFDVCAGDTSGAGRLVADRLGVRLWRCARHQTGRIWRKGRPPSPRAVGGSYDRAVTLPVDIDADRVRAEYHDGIQALYLPRAERDKPKAITVA
jgi:Hsp20/alpha crystallin family